MTILYSPGKHIHEISNCYIFYLQLAVDCQALPRHLSGQAVRRAFEAATTLWPCGCLGRLHSSLVQRLPVYNCRRLAYMLLFPVNKHVTWQLVCSCWVSNGSQRELLQHSQFHHQGAFQHVSISARRKSWSFLRAVLQWKLKQALEQWQSTGRQKCTLRLYASFPVLLVKVLE